MLSFKNRNLKVYLFFFLFFIGVVILFFNENGVLKYSKLQKEVNSLNEQVNYLEAKNKSLSSEIDSLQRKEPAIIEKIAREKYGMKRKGEETIEIIEK
ncbi:MAG TPA: septum formation initiator family protein [Ignavibacteriaceae bacterium]|nr:septum formation initiator family protein [Ignavibacteriaceae bacterium]